MATLFAILTFVSLIGLVLGLIKPKIVRIASRKHVLYFLGGATILFFILFAVTTPPVVKTESDSQTNQTDVLATSMSADHSNTTASSTGNTATPVSANTAWNISARTKTDDCISNQALPDSECTPGAVLTTDTSIICVSGYTKTVRDVPDSERQEVFKEYGIDYSLHDNYEVDHLISLELGGSNDISNLWPEAHALSDNEGSFVKDKLENYLHAQACDGKITMKQAQYEIATNWIKYYQQAYGTTSQSQGPQTVPAAVSAPTTQANATVPTNTTNTTGPETKKSTSGICHERGTEYYSQTTNYTSYDSVQACLDSGGRLPK